MFVSDLLRRIECRPANAKLVVSGVEVQTLYLIVETGVFLINAFVADAAGFEPSILRSVVIGLLGSSL